MIIAVLVVWTLRRRSSAGRRILPAQLGIGAAERADVRGAPGTTARRPSIVTEYMAGSTLPQLTEPHQQNANWRSKWVASNAVCPLGYTSCPFATTAASRRDEWISVVHGRSVNGKVAPIAAIREMPRTRSVELACARDICASGATRAQEQGGLMAIPPVDRAGVAGASVGRYQPPLSATIWRARIVASASSRTGTAHSAASIFRFNRIITLEIRSGVRWG
jgi:hypothetical protein